MLYPIQQPPSMCREMGLPLMRGVEMANAPDEGALRCHRSHLLPAARGTLGSPSQNGFGPNWVSSNRHKRPIV
jgi:hypothetical protein